MPPHDRSTGDEDLDGHGHGLGAGDVRVFAADHPDQVAGLALPDMLDDIFDSQMTRSQMVRIMVRITAVVLGAVVASGQWSVLPAEAAERSFDLDGYVVEAEERIEANLDRFSVPGAAIALAVDGEVVWAAGAGVADVATGRTVQPDTRFQAGSLTKSVMAWTVLHLAIEGTIDLDGPVETQIDGWSLPDTPYDTVGVTPRRLLEHRSGLPFSIDATPRSPAVFRTGQVDPDAFTLVQEPGAGFIYSNPGYALLALLVEDATGDDLATVVGERVLQPLGMLESTFALDVGDQRRAATGHTVDGDTVEATWPSPLGASGLHTTAPDLARLVAATHHGAQPAGLGVLPPAQVDQLLQPRARTDGLPHRLMTDATAYGHFVDDLDGVQLVLNAGEEEGWVGGFATAPAAGHGIVILTNSRNGYPLLIEELRAWSEATGLGTPRFVGVYDGLRVGAWIAIVVLATTSVVLVAVSTRRGRQAATWRAGAASSRRSRLVAAGSAVLLLAGWWGLAFPVVRPFLPDLTAWLSLTVTATAALLVLRAAWFDTRHRRRRSGDPSSS